MTHVIDEPTLTRAGQMAQSAFCRLRYLARYPLNDAGRQYLFLLADAAHNIPVGMAGDQYHATTLSDDLARLEAMLSEPLMIVLERFMEKPDEMRQRRGLKLMVAGFGTAVVGALLAFASLPEAGLVFLGAGIACFVPGYHILTTTQQSSSPVGRPGCYES